VGADLNTWAGGTREQAFLELRRHLPRAEIGARFARWLTLDYLFFRVPPSWHVESRPAGATFGSDHRPIVSHIRLGA
jgi:endonuclease/exonuclease/phosphatase (EEP) superfamily protein YafD